MPVPEKSSVEEIRQRFDDDVERFSNLETGQAAIIDASLTLEILASVAESHCPTATSLLDIGCGAGNFSLKLLGKIPGMHCTLIDLSLPMLDRAKQRLESSTAKSVRTLQADVREVDLPDTNFEIVVAASVLHHLRTDDQWESTFHKIWKALAPGGILLVNDLISSEVPAVEAVQNRRYGDYLVQFRDEQYRQTVFDYIEKEDSPRSLAFQLETARKVGFRQVDVLHANACFGAFCAVK